MSDDSIKANSKNDVKQVKQNAQDLLNQYGDEDQHNDKNVDTYCFGSGHSDSEIENLDGE